MFREKIDLSRLISDFCVNLPVGGMALFEASVRQMSRILIRNPYMTFLVSPLRVFLFSPSRLHILLLSGSCPGRSFSVCSSYVLRIYSIRRMYEEHTEKLRRRQGGDRAEVGKNGGKRGKRILPDEICRLLKEC